MSMFQRYALSDSAGGNPRIEAWLMKRKGKTTFVRMSCLVLMLGVSTSAWCEQSRPLEPGENLSYETEFDKKRMLLILKIYHESKIGRALVRKYEGLVCNAPQLTPDRRIIFFVLNVRDDKYDPNYLYVYDGVTGRDSRLFRTTCQYSITTDARYICFERRAYRRIVPWQNGKGEDALSIPVVVLIDPNTMEEKPYDFADSFLRDQWGAGVYIKYDVRAGGFRVRFFMEERTYSKGIISLQDFRYHEDKN